MDTVRGTRSCKRHRSAPKASTARGSKQICIPMMPEQYEAIWANAKQVRAFLETALAASPELFPAAMSNGYR